MSARAARPARAEAPFPPDAEEQRRMLEQQRDGFRRNGFNAHMELVALEATEGPGTKDTDAVIFQAPNGALARSTRGERRAELQRDERDAYRIARAYQKQIDALPKPPKKGEE